MDSFFKRASPYFFPAFVFVLTCLNGGRGNVPLAVYLAASFLFFLIVFREKPLPKTQLDIPFLFAFSVALANVALHFPSGFRGTDWLAVGFSYLLNFYCFMVLRGDFLTTGMSWAAMISSVVMSATLLALSMRDVLFPNFNLLSSFLNCGAIAAFSSWIGARGEKTQSGDKEYGPIYLLSFAVIALAQVRGRSVSGCAALAAGLVVCAYAQRMGLRKIFYGLLAVIAGFIFLMRPAAGLSNKLTVLQDNFRFPVWRSAWAAFLEKPWTGWGLGNFELAYDVHKWPIDSLVGRFAKTTPFAHSEPLQLMVELGAAGVIGIIWLGASYLGCLKRAPREETARPGNAWALGCVVALGLQALVDFNLRLPIIGLLFVFFCAQFVPAAGARDRRVGFALRMFGLALLGVFAAGWALKSDWTSNPEREKALRRNVSLDPRNAHPYAELAIFYFENKAPEKALKEYGHAMEYSPKNPFYAAEAGNACLMLNQIDVARGLFERAAILEPFYMFAHFRMGEIDLSRGRKAAARNAFENVVKIHESRLRSHRISFSDYERRLVDFDVRIARDQLRRLVPEKS